LISDDPGARRRLIFVGSVLAAMVLAYIALFAVSKAVVVFREETFASPAAGGGLPLAIYVDLAAVDPVRLSMDVRLDVASAHGARGKHYGGRLNRDVELLVSDGDIEQEYTLRRGDPLSSRAFVAGLQGAVARYPFDSYATRIAVSAVELSANNGRKAIPVRATLWEGVPAWDLRVAQLRPLDSAQGLTLALDVRRPVPLVFFACVIYSLIGVIAVCAITIGALVFVGTRRLEVTLVGALAGMVFALPIMRNILPGAPPLGVLPDIFILLWAEVAVAVGLILFVTAWAQRGSQP
jgi:hypothetical protein